MFRGTTAKQDRNFLDEVIGLGVLEAAVEWIAKNMEPEDVFSQQQIRTSAQQNNMPDDVFGEKELAAWAESNGFVSSEE